MYYRKKPVVIEAHRWFMNGDHPEDFSDRDNGEGIMRREGMLVRYYRRPDVPGESLCEQCGKPHNVHGWVDTLEQGHRVCPGDWIIKGVEGEYYPCKPSVFETTYEPVTTPKEPTMTEKITREEIEALLKLAGAATPLDLSTAQKVRDSDEIVCPTCDGDGCVPAKDWCNIDGHAIGIQVYGIGDQMAAMENFVYAANPAVIKALCTLALQAEAMREALIETAASLSAAHSLLSRGGKRAAPSNKMFAVMLEDYRKSLDRAVATLSSLPEPRR